ncbi:MULTISPECIES: LPXTG cell wall anchor domain-containing protein [Mammaliicoccus]|uniref:LPXTG cell wall anchor domain-containing protein n=1 Tax=Mammaliicoccus TaxID=2803850 RepID=UPI000992A2D5|nr:MULTISPECIES: LPXTG cell wall anchor domain-containing protein [Mammaliicoccus]MEB8067733.1 LPXTG cell wall anchor domain-containing protein [Mammaliicoccus fleurettii]OOV78177.1 hypothetical protein B2G86_04205 [Mammaliicoccus fleurettii]
MLKKVFLSTLLCTIVSAPIVGKVNAEELKENKPVKYVFKSSGKAAPIYINSDGSMSIPEKEILEVKTPDPEDFYIIKNGVKTNEVNPKYKHISDQWRYFEFYASKGRVNDLFVGEHPRPLDGINFDPSVDNPNSYNQTNMQQPGQQSNTKIPNGNQEKPPSPDQLASDNKGKPTKKDPNKDKKDDKEVNPNTEKKDDKKAEIPKNTVVNKDNKVAVNDKKVKQSANEQNKTDMNTNKSEPKSSEASKQDNNKDVKSKEESVTKVKAKENKSNKSQKELPKTGENDNVILRYVLFTFAVLSAVGIFSLSRKVKS